jgi:hypothetical protein
VIINLTLLPLLTTQKLCSQKISIMKSKYGSNIILDHYRHEII